MLESSRYFPIFGGGLSGDISDILQKCRFRVESASYLANPPTDPYVKVSLIRFLKHNFATLKQLLRCCG